MLSRSEISKTKDAALALAFLVLLSVPCAIGAIQGFPWQPSGEKRQPIPFPTSPSPRSFESWWNDHFGLRRSLLRLSSRVRLAANVSSTPMVILGKDGWLFYTGDHAVSGFRRIETLDDAVLGEWRDALAARKRWFSARGIHYVVVLNPTKESIYPEAMPSQLNRLPGASATERIMGLLSALDIDYIDNITPLAAARSAGAEVFHRTDTHWNGIGMLAGYRATMSHLAAKYPSVRPYSRSDFDIESTTTEGGDLAGLLALPDEIVEHTSWSIRPRTPRAREADPNMTYPADIAPHMRPLAWSVDDASLPSAVILGDSFMLGLAPLMAEHFSRTLYYGRHDMDASVIEREHPNVVIEGWLERYLLTGVPAYGPAFGNPSRSKTGSQTTTNAARASH